MATYKIDTLFTVTYDNLKNAINGIKSQFKSVEQSADNAKRKISDSFKTTKSDIENTNKAIEKSNSLIDSGLKTATIGIAAITIPTILAGKSALTMAGQYEAATQTLEYTLGNAKNIVDDFVENNAQKIGMAEQDAYKFANIYSNLLTTMTSDQATNAEYTNKLMQASAVIMSKTGRTFTDVADRIRSGLLGNTEAIEDLGVNVNVALLETTEAFSKIADGRSWEQLTFQEQQQVRLLGILEQTSKKYREEVGNNLSLKLAQTSASFKNVRTEASQFLAVGLEPILGMINNVLSGIMVFVQYLNSLDDGTKKAITTFIVIVAIIPVVALVFLTLIKAINSYIIFTKTASLTTQMLTKSIMGLLGGILLLIAGIALLAYAFGAFDNSAKNINKTSKNTSTATKALDGLSTSQNNNAKSAKNAAKANKELADNLQGFDEINKLNLDNNVGSGSDLDSSIGPSVDLSGIDTGAFDDIGNQFGNLTNGVEDFKQKLENLKPVLMIIGGILSGLGIFTLLGGLKGINSILNFISSGIYNIGTFLLNNAKTIGGIILLIGAIKTGFDSIQKLFEGDLKGSFLDFLKTIGLIVVGVTLLIGIVPALIVALVAAIAYLITILVTNWEAFCVGCEYIWETMCNAIKDFFQGIADWFSQKWLELKTGWKYICDSIGDFFTGVWQGIKDFFQGIVDWFNQKWLEFKTGWEFVCDITSQVFKNAWQAIKDFFGGIWQWICDKANNIGESFSNVWENVKNGFINVWNTIKDFAQKIGTTVSNAVGGTIQSVLNSIIGFAENTINGFIRAINNAINIINNLPGVKISKLTELNIPRVNWYANGGVFGTTSIIGVGEYAGAKSNPEIVTPKNMMYDTIIQANKDSQQENNYQRNNSSDTINKKIEVELNLKSGGVKLGKQIVDLVLDANDFYDLGLI